MVEEATGGRRKRRLLAAILVVCLLALVWAVWALITSFPDPAARQVIGATVIVPLPTATVSLP